MSKEIKLIPELRFPEFQNDMEWEEKVFQQVFDRLTTKNNENNHNVLTISAQKGLVSQLEYFNKKVSAKDVSGYYLLHKDDFAYNKSYSKGYPMGAIKPLKYYDKGVVSTLYICFRTKDGYNPSFFEQYFDAGLLNSEIAKIAQEGGRAHGLLNVSVKEFFKTVNLLVPKPREQQKIASCLSSLDELIAAHTDKLDALKDHKKGLLQNLFPQKGETVPKVRFLEFERDGDWVEKALGKIAENLDSKRVPITSNKREKGKIPYYGASGIIDYVKEYIFDEDLLLISEDGANLKARVYPIAFSISGKTWVNNHAHVLKFDNWFTQVLVEMYLNSKNIEDFLTGMAQPKLNRKKLDIIPIPLPKNPKEQQKVASCLTAVDGLITAQKEKIVQLQQHKKGLMQGLFPKIES